MAYILVVIKFVDGWQCENLNGTHVPGYPFVDNVKYIYIHHQQQHKIESRSCTVCTRSNAYIHLPVEVLTDMVAFCSSYLWHSTLRVTVYVVPGFSDVMLEWRSGFIILPPIISSEASSGWYCCHESIYVLFLQQDVSWSQVRLIHVVPTVTFSIMGGWGPSVHVQNAQR